MNVFSNYLESEQKLSIFFISIIQFFIIVVQKKHHYYIAICNKLFKNIFFIDVVKEFNIISKTDELILMAYFSELLSFMTPEMKSKIKYFVYLGYIEIKL